MHDEDAAIGIAVLANDLSTGAPKTPCSLDQSGSGSLALMGMRHIGLGT